MRIIVLYIILSIQFFSFNLYAQDDSEENTANTPIFREEELDEEKNNLVFKKSFIESLQYKAIENHKKSLKSLAVCEKIYPENVSMLFEFAKNYFALNQFIEAHHYCDKAHNLKPDDFWILALSKEIFEKEQNYTEAIRIQKQLYSYKPSEAGNLLRLYYRTKKMREGKKLITEIEHKFIYVLALDFYKKFFKTEKNQPLLNSDKKKLAKRELSDLKREFSKNKKYHILQEILEKENQTKQFANLLKDSELGLSLFPAQAELYLYKGLALNGLGKHKEAVLILESGLDYVFDDALLSKQLYQALIVGYKAVKNTVKVNYYKKMVQKL